MSYMIAIAMRRVPLENPESGDLRLAFEAGWRAAELRIVVDARTN